MRLIISGHDVYVSPRALKTGSVSLSYPEQRGFRTKCEDCGLGIEKAKSHKSLVLCECGATYKVLP